MKKIDFLVALGLVLLVACGNPDNIEISSTNVSYDLKDPITQKVLEATASGKAEDIIAFFNSSSEPAKLMASKLLSSFAPSSSSAVKQTIKNELSVTTSPEKELLLVRALGVHGDTTDTNILITRFQRDSFNYPLKKEILTAVGKIGSPQYLDLISKESSYQYKEPEIIEAQANCLYAYGQRGIVTKASTKRMADIAVTVQAPNASRILASQYLLKLKPEEYENYHNPLLLAFNGADNQNIKSVLTEVVTAIHSTGSLMSIQEALKQESNPVLMANYLEALSTFDYKDVREQLLQFAVDTSGHGISSLAGRLLYEKGNSTDALQYLRIAEIHPDTLARAQLFKAAFKHGTPIIRTYTTSGLARMVSQTVNPHYKADLISAYSGYPYNFSYIYNQMTAHRGQKAISTNAYKTLMNYFDDPLFDSFVKANPKARNSLLYTAREGALEGDIAKVTLAKAPLTLKNAPYSLLFAGGFSFLNKALKNTVINKDQKAYTLLDELRTSKAIAKDTTLTVKPKSPKMALPDWKVLTSQENPSVRFSTNKGSFTVAIQSIDAPLASAVFLKNVSDGIYNDSYFHHEIMGGLLQTGCSRGDGYSYTLDTLPKENTSHSFDGIGKIAFATDGSKYGTNQWFITLKPMLTLDNSHSVVGDITKGLETLAKLHKGDKIISAEILNN